MPDYVVLKRLTLNSDLGWFKSIFDGHGLSTKQKAITLNKGVMNKLWPSLQIRQSAYERHKAAQDAARALGASGNAVYEAEKAAAKAVGTIPVHVELHGPGGKPPLPMDRIIALQDKNWRLNGDFVTDPPGDPRRFYSVMREGDLALIGFNDVGWPADPIVVLISQSADAPLWAALQGRVTKGLGSMVQVDPADLLTLANAQSLPTTHVIRVLAGGLTAPVAAFPPLAAPAPGSLPIGPVPAPPRTIPSRPRRPSPSPKITPAQLAAQLAVVAEVGELGEKVVDAYLAARGTSGQPTYTWISQAYATHPYDFELLSASGAVHTVIDAKATSGPWTNVFHMSSAEVAYAAASVVPYYIYRVSGVAAGKPCELRISDDLRPLAAAVENASLATAQPGTRVTAVAIDPQTAGITWGAPIPLPPPPP